MIPELLVIPAPLMVNLVAGSTVTVNGLAPGLNTMPLTSVSAEMDTAVIKVIVEDANVAVSADPLGTTSPDQLEPVFQSPVKKEGVAIQVPLPAKLDSIVRIKTSAARSQVTEAARMRRSCLAVRLFILICFVFMGSAAMDG